MITLWFEKVHKAAKAVESSGLEVYFLNESTQQFETILGREATDRKNTSARCALKYRGKVLESKDLTSGAKRKLVETDTIFLPSQVVALCAKVEAEQKVSQVSRKAFKKVRKVKLAG